MEKVPRGSAFREPRTHLLLLPRVLAVLVRPPCPWTRVRSRSFGCWARAALALRWGPWQQVVRSVGGVQARERPSSSRAVAIVAGATMKAGRFPFGMGKFRAEMSPTGTHCALAIRDCGPERQSSGPHGPAGGCRPIEGWWRMATIECSAVAAGAQRCTAAASPGIPLFDGPAIGNMMVVGGRQAGGSFERDRSVAAVVDDGKMGGWGWKRAPCLDAPPAFGSPGVIGHCTSGLQRLMQCSLMVGCEPKTPTTFHKHPTTFNDELEFSFSLNSDCRSQHLRCPPRGLTVFAMPP